MDLHPVVKKLVALRKARGLNQSELGRLSGVRRECIWKYENGVFEPNLESLTRWTKALGVKLRIE